jgi:hypothetical protein
MSSFIFSNPSSRLRSPVDFTVGEMRRLQHAPAASESRSPPSEAAQLLLQPRGEGLELVVGQ